MRAPDRGRVRLTVVVVLLTAGAAVGCGGTPQGPAEDSTAPATTSAPASGGDPTGRHADTSPSASPTPTTPAPSTTGDRPRTGTTITVTGTVAEGVEAGCLVLRSGETTYLLLGDHDDLTPGADVAVTGILAEDLATTCQQGTPLQPLDVRPG